MVRNLVGIILHSDGTPWEDATVYLTLVEGTFNSNNEHFPGEVKPYKTDSGGNISIPVTPNTGVQPGYYIIRLPDNKKITFTIPEGDADIDLDVVRESSIIPTDPEYENFLQFLQDYVDTAIANIEISGGSPIASATVSGRVKTSSTVADPIVPLASEVTTSLTLKADLSALTSHTGNTSNPHVVTAGQVGAIATSARGAVNGVASLDSSGLIPDSQIPPGVTRDSELTVYYLASQVDTLLGNKVNNSTLNSYYLATEVDTLLNGKVNTSTLTNYYLRTEVDNLLATKLNSNDVSVTNSRTPTGNAGGDLGGTYPNPTINTVPIAKGGTGATSANAARTALGVPAISDLTSHTGNTSNPHDTTAVQVGAIATSARGALNGVASLDSGGKIPDSEIGSSLARLSVSQQFTARQGINANVVTFSATPTANLALSNRHYLTLTGNVTTFDASNLSEGAYTFHFIQDGTGGRTLSFAAKFRFIDTPPTLSTAANTRDIMTCDCDGTNLYCVMNKGWS